MLKDITIGQHFPGHSILHRCDPRLKLVATIAYIVVLFVAPNPLGLALSILLLAALYKVAQIPGKMILKSLKPIVPIVIFTAVLNLFFVTGQGEPLVHFWILNIYVEGVKYAILLAVRVCALIAGTSLLTYTTSPIVLTDAIESLLRPLAKLHFPVHELAMMMTIALRFIPTLIEETEKIMNAQKARGAMLDSGTFTQRIKALVPILIPLFISAFRRADGMPLLSRRRGPHPAQAAEIHRRGLQMPGGHCRGAGGHCLHTILCAGAGVRISRLVGAGHARPAAFPQASACLTQPGRACPAPTWF